MRPIRKKTPQNFQYCGFLARPSTPCTLKPPSSRKSSSPDVDACQVHRWKRFTAGPETFLSAKCAGTTSSGLDAASTSHIFALGRSAWTRTGHSSSGIIGTIIPATVSQSRACTAALSLHVFPAHATCHLLPAHLLQEGSDRASRLQSSVTSSCQPPPAKAKIAADSQHGVELVRGFGFLLSNMRSLRLERSAQGSCAGHPDLSCSWRCHWARRHGPQHVLFRSSRT